MKSTNQQPKINSIHSWTSAFFIFSAIYLNAHPNRTQEVLKYGHTVRTAAARFEEGGWKEYDRQFRLRHQSHPEMSWATIDYELWSFYVAVPYYQPQKPTSNFPNNQRPANFRNSGTVNPSASGRGTGRFCYDFNSLAGCKRPNCMFRHTCQVCRRDGHCTKDCRSKNKVESQLI